MSESDSQSYRRRLALEVHPDTAEDCPILLLADRLDQSVPFIPLRSILSSAIPLAREAVSYFVRVRQEDRSRRAIPSRWRVLVGT
jgi:hypothetical protein